MPEPLPHNRASGVTQDLFRERRGDRSVVVKRIGRRTEGVPRHWLPSEDPRHWNYWQREVLVYAEGLPERLRLGAPDVVAIDRRDDGSVDVVLEDVEGRGAAELTLDDLAATAAALGRSQGHPVPRADDDWLSRGFLRAYTTAKPYDRSLLYDDGAWADPLVATHFAGLRDRLVELHEQRDWYFGVIERAEPTVCHLDCWMNNVLRRPDGRVAFVDWAFVGEGARGEDPSNLVIDSVMDLLWPIDRLRDLDTAVYEAYLDGLREAGWEGDERRIRLQMCASAVKYEWLAPLMLAQTQQTHHLAYGQETDADTLFAARGAGLRLVTDYAAEARALA